MNNEPQRQKCIFAHVRPAKIQISLRIRAVWSESSLGTFWIDKDEKFLYADNKDFDQADLNLCWAHMSASTFSYDPVQLFLLFSSRMDGFALFFPYKTILTHSYVPLVYLVIKSYYKVQTYEPLYILLLP